MQRLIVAMGLIIGSAAVSAQTGPDDAPDKPAPRANKRLGSPSEVMDNARLAFRIGDYSSAIPLLTYLLYPQPKLSTSSDLKEAYLLLGIAHFELGAEVQAKKELEKALFLDPKPELDPSVFSERAINFLASFIEELKEDQKRDEELRKLGEEANLLREKLRNTVVVEKKSYYINFLPLGAGQFQNGHRGKGLAFFSTQLGFGGASLGLFTYQVAKYGFNGAVPPSEASSVDGIRTAQVLTGVACLGSLAWGIVDALANYESEKTLGNAEDFLDKRDKGKKKKPKASLSKPSEGLSLGRPMVMPMLDPNSAGLTMGWSF